MLSVLKCSRSSTPIGSLMKQQTKCRRNTSPGPLVPGGNWCSVHPWWRWWTCSARHTKYGIHPTSPSVKEMRSSGNFPNASHHSISPSVKIDAADDVATPTLGGASGDTGGTTDEENTWQHSTVPTSHAAAKTGSQNPEWMLGILSASGRSENETAWQPLPAKRLISSAAASASHIGSRPHGMNRSGYAPHHSST